MAQIAGLEFELIARHDRPLESRLIETHQVIRTTLAHQPFDRATGQQSRRLGHRLDDENPRHDGNGWEVSGKEGFVVGHVLHRKQSLAWLHLKHPVNQQKRIAMGQVFLDFLDIQTCDLC